MKKITYDLIKSFEPCYDPIKYIPKDYEGTIIDILKMDNVPHKDRLWLALRSDFISDKTLRLYAVYCYRQTLKFVKDQDTRSINAANVAEAYALGKATEKELKEAESVAWSAVRAAELVAWSAAKAAAKAAESVAKAAESAAKAAARAAESAAKAAARAAESAAKAAARAAAKAAESVAWSAAESDQRNKLIEMIEEEETDKNG